MDWGGVKVLSTPYSRHRLSKQVDYFTPSSNHSIRAKQYIPRESATRGTGWGKDIFTQPPSTLHRVLQHWVTLVLTRLDSSRLFLLAQVSPTLMFPKNYVR